MRLHDYREYYARETPDHAFGEFKDVRLTYAGLAGYKVPRRFERIAELPRNASGKVLKKDLREPFWEGIDRRVG